MTRRTSIEAYHQIKDEGLLTEARLVVYEILFERGPLTAGEVFLWMRRMNQGHTVVKGSVCARLTELRDTGVVAEVGKRECELTGHTAILWDVTENIPFKLEKRKSKDAVIREKDEIIANLKAHIHSLDCQLATYVPSRRSGELF